MKFLHRCHRLSKQDWPRAEIAIVFLIRRQEGIEPLRRFLAAYAMLDPGTAHCLIVALKDAGREPSPGEHEDLLSAHNVRVIRVPDGGFDIGSYWYASRIIDADAFCFLNSHSVPQADAWLVKMYRHLLDRDIGLVGATGSYEVHTSLTPEIGRVLRRVRPYRALKKVLIQRHFPPFPNAHVRTNAFMLQHRTLKRIRTWSIKTKADAYRFEGGRDGLTAQMRSLGLSAVVVGADGRAYSPAAWPESRTFRSANQENLLVADNHTRFYAHAGQEERERLRMAAWGGRGISWQ